MAKQVIVKEGQSLFDLALQEYGHWEGVFDLVARNQLSGVVDRLHGGDTLSVSDTPQVLYAQRYLRDYTLATLTAAEQGSGIEWWAVGNDFVVS